MEWYRGPVRGFEVSFADLIAWGLAIGMILRSPSKIVWLPRFSIVLLLYFLYTIFSLLRAGNDIIGWFAVWQLLRMGIMYWVTVNFFETEEVSEASIGTLIIAYAISGIILAAVTFKQKYIDGIYRAWAFFDHSNTIPSFAIMMLCVLLVWLLYEERIGFPTFLVTLFASLGILFSIFATGSRTGMAASVILVIGSLIIANRRNPNPRTRRTTYLILFFLFLGSLFVVDTVIERFINAPVESEQAREEFEIAAEMMAKDHPTGVGINLYTKVLTEVRAYREHIVVMRYESQAGVAHHIFLLTAAELGYSGMYTLVGIIMLFFGSMTVGGIGWNTMGQRLLLALAMSFAMVCVIGLYEWVLRQSPVLYQTVVALGFGQALCRGGQKTHEQRQ